MDIHVTAKLATLEIIVKSVSCLSTYNLFFILINVVVSLIFSETFSVDIDECSSAPCLNDGNCIDNVNGYMCNCSDGYPNL